MRAAPAVEPRYIEADPAHPLQLETVWGVSDRFIAEGADEAARDGQASYLQSVLIGSQSTIGG